jgi:hypothetical protein
VVKFSWFTTHASPYTRPDFDSGFFLKCKFLKISTCRGWMKNFKKISKNKNKNNAEAAHVLW